MKNLVILIAICFVNSFGFTQSKISGFAENQEGGIIKLVKYDDFLTFKTVEIGRDTIDSLGFYSISTNIERTTFCILESAVLLGLYLEANVNYEVTIEPIDTNLNYNTEPVYVTPSFSDKSLDNINNLIAQFNLDYDEFVSYNLNLFIQKNAKHKVDTFYIDMLNKYEKYNSNFFSDYLNYSIANLKSASAYSSKKELYHKYFKSSPILYNNDSYMDFFNQFYKSHIKTMPVRFQDELIDAITVKMDMEVLNDILKRDPYLSNDSIRELVMIKTLKENYRNPSYSRKGILMILDQVIKATNNDEHLKIAINIRQKLSSIAVGSYAPDFKLADMNGDFHALSELSRYKYVYLDFWATWCAPCIKEMKLMPELYREFGDDIEFVSISIDKKQKVVQKFIERNKYDWTILYLNENEELLKMYQTKVIPSYFLIAPGGKVLKSPAARPSEIRFDLEKIQKVNAGRK